MLVIRRSVCLLALGATVSLAGAADGDGKPEPPNTRFHVNLSDGSSIVCTPLVNVLPIKTSYAELSIPFHRLRKVELDRKEEKAVVKFMNGDVLRGICPLESMEIETVLGKLTIPMKHVSEIVSAAKEEEPAPVYSDSPEKRQQCINILRQIDSAKEQFAMANKLGDAAVVQGPAIGAYIRGGWDAVRCPAGGKYTINPVGRDPVCSVPGHSLKTLNHGHRH